MNYMLDQIQSQPLWFDQIFEPIDDAIRTTLDHELCLSIKRIFISGCGDSYFAALGSDWAFENLARIPTLPVTSLQFARYEAGFIPSTGPKTNLVIGISVSGSVSRTVEALRMGNEMGAITLAICAAENSPITEEAHITVLTPASPLPEPPEVIIPGIRSYLVNQLVLLLIAVRLGEVRGRFSSSEAGKIRDDIKALRFSIEKTISICDKKAKQLVQLWADAQEFIFIGGGPNYGTALFSAAKILEASGDSAFGQDTEEWGHLQYFARKNDTPTLIITAGDRDLTRAAEVAVAAHAIGRRTAAIAPESASILNQVVDSGLSIENVQEMFSPIVAAIPGELIAAYRSELIGEKYFRNFSGGRSIEHGGGISRIRTSEAWNKWQPL